MIKDMTTQALANCIRDGIAVRFEPGDADVVVRFYQALADKYPGERFGVAVKLFAATEKQNTEDAK